MTAASLSRTWIAMSVVLLVAGAGAMALFLSEDSPPGDVMLKTEAIDLSPLDKLPAASWESLARKRIYFGHQSVGYDIIKGLEEIALHRPQIRLEIVETDQLGQRERPAFVHSRVGTNGDPEAKIRDFAQRLVSAPPGSVDVSCLKLCYVDVVASTSIERLFATYKATMARLEQQLPQTSLIYCTVPLTAPRTGLKARLKRLLGRVPGDDADNRARQAFNRLVRAEYQGKRALLDVAAAESTLPDGSAVTFALDGDVVPCLARCYTTDGGHLNEVGRLAVARDMLLQLGALAQ